MLSLILVVGALCATTLPTIEATIYKKEKDCGDDVHVYKYTAVESYFGKKYTQTFDIVIDFKITCLSAGKYGNNGSKLYSLEIIDTKMGGNILARDSSDSSADTNVDWSGWFQFIQTDNGLIPVTFYSREQDANIINIKKAIVSAFQVNYLGEKLRSESDPQSQHISNYTASASIQDMKNGIVNVHREIVSGEVVGYAQHVPNEEVKLVKREDLTYKKGKLSGAKGTIYCKLMTEENVNQDTDRQSDSLENERQQDKRDTVASEGPYNPDVNQTYYSNVTTNSFESSGNYTLTFVKKYRSRNRRSVIDHADLPNAVMTSLLGSINQTQKVMMKIIELCNFLGDIRKSLKFLHDNPQNLTIAHKLEKLIKLEAEYGQAPSFDPAIDIVLEYLKPLIGSNSTKDIRMRFQLYFIIAPAGSISSQMALLQGFEKAVNDDEEETVAVYISIVAKPQPRFVARLEYLISSDVHLNHPLLLAYGALLSRASPELQHRMILFLFDRLPEAETNNYSLIHHILSLGNTASPKMSDFLVSYLSHSEVDVQLSTILAMRFIMDDALIQMSLKEFVSGPKVTADHLTMIGKALLYGTERAKVNGEEKPYSPDIAQLLVLSALGTSNDELISSLTSYLETINTEHSKSLLRYMQNSSTTRFRRGNKWAESKPEYDLVESSTDRVNDTKQYPSYISYIWGKQLGGKDINIQVAAGVFAGANDTGDYKLFGHAVAKAHCYDYTLTMLEFLVMRKKDELSTVSDLYAVVMGNTVKKVHVDQDSTVCKTYDEPVYEAKEYTIFDFTYSVFVVVGTLDFELTAHAHFTAGLYVEFCEGKGRITAGAGLSPTITLTVAATGDLEVALVAKAGLTLSATLNYQLLPEVTSNICYSTKDGVSISNCIGIYHQWEDNKIELYAWYAWRGWCGWFVCTGKDAYKKKHKIDALSFSWNVKGTGKMTIYKKCLGSLTCTDGF